MSIIIRDYAATDRAACVSVFESNTPGFFDPSERAALDNWLNAKDRQEIAYASNRVEKFYVLEQDHQVLACGGFYIPAGKEEATMVWGMVHNSLHKKGLGRRLLEYRIDIIRREHAGVKILLDTTQHSSGFFEQMGFTVTAVTPDFYGPGLHRHDMELA